MKGPTKNAVKGVAIGLAATVGVVVVGIGLAAAVSRDDQPEAPDPVAPALAQLEEVASIPRNGLNFDGVVYTFCDHGNRVYVTYGKDGRARHVGRCRRRGCGMPVTRLVAAFCTAVAVVNGAHPLLHMMEGGSLDLVLGYLNATAADLAGRH